MTTPDMRRPLTDRVALVTGGSRGIGRAIALRLAADGAAVAISLVATDMGERLVRGATGRTLDDVSVGYPFGRTCLPADVAAVVAFLASSDAAYLAGVRIAVDGGGNQPAIVAG